MKKKLSLGEKKLIRTMLSFVAIQIIIIFVFIHMLNGSQPIDINDTRQIDIVVNDIYKFRFIKENNLLVIGNSTKFYFFSHSTSKEYSVSELYNAISKGDKLSLRYYEVNNIWGKSNIVVDARSEMQVYRSIKEFNRGKQGLPAGAVVLFSIMELALLGFALMYVWLNHNTINVLSRRLKKRLFNSTG